jgi:hypothetical protein
MKLRVVALLVASFVAGCRSGDSCEDSKCIARGCLTDGECDDGLACNGAETCDGRCVEGTPVECEEGLACEDRGGTASCEFPEWSPWYVYVGDDLGKEPFRLFGVRQADFGRRVPIELSAGVATDEYLGPTFHSFSPDGRFLVFDMMTAEFQSRLFFSKLGAGWPSAAARLAELPFADGWFPWVLWSARGDVALVQESLDYYWLDFRGEAPSASAFDPEVPPTEVWPCADGESVVYETEAQGVFVAAGARPEDAESVGDGEVLVAPDGSRFAVFSPSGVLTADCELGAPRRTLETRAIEEPRSGWGWSPDSRFLAYSLPDVTEGPFEVVIVDVEGDAEPWTAFTLDSDAYWDTNTARFVFALESTGELSVATFPGGEVSSLGLPEGAFGVTLHESAVSYGVRDENDEPGDWLRVDGTGETHRLDGCKGSTVIFNDGPTLAACVEENEAGASFVAFTLDGGALARTRLGAPVPQWLFADAFSPDGRGFVGSRSASTDESATTLLWVAAPFEQDASPVAINPGTLAYAASFQPKPPSTSAPP